MKPVESRITSKGQITVPAAVRERLELGLGARIEWLEHEGEIVVRLLARDEEATCDGTVHAAGTPPPRGPGHRRRSCRAERLPGK